MFRQRFLGEICLAREFGKVQDYNLGTCFITLFWKDLFGLKVWWQQGYHHTYVIALHLISSLLFFDWLLQVVMSPMGITFLDVYILKWHLIWAELYGGLYLHLVLFDFDKKKNDSFDQVKWILKRLNLNFYIDINKWDDISICWIINLFKN